MYIYIFFELSCIFVYKYMATYTHTVPLNYNFTITRVITRGIMRTLTCIPVTCLRGPRLLIAWNAYVLWYTRVEVSTCVE